MMYKTITGKVEKIGNSNWIRIPGTLLGQASLSGEVEMRVAGDQLIIQPIRKPREGWDRKFELMSANHDDPLLDEITQSAWDEEEWTGSPEIHLHYQ